MLTARRSTLTGLFAACAIFAFSLYTVEVWVMSYCTPENILHRSSGGDGATSASSKTGLQSSSENDANPIPGKFYKDGYPYYANEPMRFPDISSPDRDSSSRASDVQSPANQRLHDANNYDILSNVSFSDTMRVIEIHRLDAARFANWTKRYMSVPHKHAFKMPRWVDDGATVCDNRTELIIIMPAVPKLVFTRELIRQTWASSIYGTHFAKSRPISLRTKLAFIVGTQGLPGPTKAALKKEASRYHDVVAADFVDSYRNLSLKMMVGLNWASTFCSGAKFVMKADLDTFVNLPLLTRFLVEVSNNVPSFVLGHIHKWPKHPVLRSGKWKVDRDDYPFESFPPYLLGHSYVITGELTPLLVDAAKHLPLIPTEDSLITGVLSRAVGAPRLHYEGFANVFKRVVSCRIVHNYEMSVTKMSLSRMVLMWRDMLTNNCSTGEMPSTSDIQSELDRIVGSGEQKAGAKSPK